MTSIIYDINDLQHFKTILAINPGLVIIKVGATWCGPCIDSKPLVNKWVSQLPKNIQFIEVDVDKSHFFYSFLKSKRMIHGVPAILCYNKGNVSYIPDDFQSGSSEHEINHFFERCLKRV